VKLFLIFGDGAVGKSSTIRALTGLFRGGECAVHLSQPQGIHEFWVEVRSLQEKEWSPEKAVALLEDKDCEFGLIALRQSEWNAQPAGFEFVHALKEAGHEVAGSCVIGPLTDPALLKLGDKTTHLDSEKTPEAANFRASVLRELWGIT